MLFLLFYLNLPLFYLFKISGSKMDLKSFLRYFYTKEKLAFPLIFLVFASYFPQHILYFLPLPHGVHLKLPCNFFLLKWAFLLKKLNSLLINCNKVMPNFLTLQFKRI